MSIVELALNLADAGFAVFPVRFDEKENTKKPYTENGHLNATRDPGVITDLWEKHPSARVGVPAGENNLVVADIDVKNGVDGWESLDKAGINLPHTFSYQTGTGGSHFVYRAPQDVKLNGQSKYRRMDGFDRRGGSSWVMWVSEEIPMEWELEDAPEWLCDPAREITLDSFEGDLQTWYELLVPGEPNALVRRAISQIEPDMGHSDMVDAEHHAIRLGAEGNPGVPALIDALYDAWMSRPEENHTTPFGDWEHKFFEALESGLEKFGGLTDKFANLPDYNFGLIPNAVPDHLAVEKNTGKSGFSALLGALVKSGANDDAIASILWNCPATTEVARDWGLQFVYKRIEEAKVKPEPTRENPRLEEERENPKEVAKGFSLLTDKEREYIAARPNFVDQVVQVAEGMGYDQTPYFRSTGWVTASMAFAFKGFIPLSESHNMGTNLWYINLGGSGTGKSVTGNFRDNILATVFTADPDDIVPFDLGDDSSPQGLHTALIERDRRASMFSSDEAAGFFAALGLKDWRTSVEERLTSWYSGKVQASNKLSQKELRGKSALAALSMHMFGTPDKVTKVIHTDMFETGFMARVNWVFGNPPRNDSSRFNLSISMTDTGRDFDEVPKELEALGIDLMLATFHRDKPARIKPAPGVMERLSEAYERMYRLSEKRENWHMIEPSLTRLSESMIKMAAIGALYRGSDTIRMDDTLHAIGAMEEYFENLHRVAGMISAGDFQRAVNDIEEWIRTRGGKATRTQIYSRFRNLILRDGRELDAYLSYLLESGAINRVEDAKQLTYEINGS